MSTSPEPKDEPQWHLEGSPAVPFASVLRLTTPKMIADASLVLQWAKEYISQPHPNLGREGAICPFVPPSIERNTFYLALHYEVDGSNLETIKHLVLQYADLFLECLPLEETERIYKAILVVFPSLPEERATILDVLHKEVKDCFVNKGMMIGQFHKNCPEPAARNPFFRISISPIPLVAMRYMSVHDILFLNERKCWFEEYQKRFGWQYEVGKVSSTTYRELYYRTKKFYSL